MTKIDRRQKVFVIRRNGRYHVKPDGWTDDVRLADQWPRKQALSKVKIDIGMPCTIVEVMPNIIEDGEVVDVDC